MSARDEQRGFTLLELMITLSIVAIGMAMAFPSFTSTIRSNRVSTNTNAMLAAVNLARTEAIRSNRGSGVCTSTNGSTCAAAGGWQQGWLVWTDLNGNGALSADEPVVRYFQGNPAMDISSTVNVISFNQRGRLVPQTQIQLVAKSSPCPAGQKLMRTITVSPVGQVRYQAGNCP